MLSRLVIAFLLRSKWYIILVIFHNHSMPWLLLHPCFR